MKQAWRDNCKRGKGDGSDNESEATR
jgi:hypothetical protein